MIEKQSSYNQDLNAAAECIRRGGIILYPTDTIWGIGCDARNSGAVKRIFELKKRADSKSMLVLAMDEKALEEIVEKVPEAARELMRNSSSPTTIIYDGARNLAPELIAEDGSIGVRITNETFSHDLCRLTGRPIVSTSANISGETAPAVFNMISPEIKNGVDYIVEYRRDDVSEKAPSRIIKISHDGKINIIR